MSQPGGAALQPLAPIIVQTLRRAGLGHVVLEGQLQRHWEEIVGEQIAAVARPERVRSRVLFVAVTDAVWLQQLTFYHSQVVRNIRRVLGDVPIAKVHFVLASSPLARPSQAPAQPVPQALRPEEEEELLAHTAEVGDSELREGIRRAWRRAWQVRR